MTNRTFTQTEVDARIAAERVDAATTALDMADVGCFTHHVEPRKCKACTAWDWVRAGAGTPADAQKALAEHDAALRQRPHPTGNTAINFEDEIAYVEEVRLKGSTGEARSE